MAEITLARGRGIALIDDSDLPWLSQFKWQLNPNGGTSYAGASIRQPDGTSKRFTMHRMIMDAKKGELIDHINCNGLDNRRCNLRFATPSMNARNRRGFGTSRFLGVHLATDANRKKKWAASAKINGKYKNLGYYFLEEDAAAAYNRAVADILGARLNQI